MISNWFKYSFFNWPSQTQSGSDCSCIQANIGCPLRNIKSPAINSDQSISTGIICLFFGRRPFAIRRFIVSVVVNTFYRKTWRAFTHIIKKYFKIIFPFFTYTDISCPISFKFWVFRIIATLNHALPCVVFMCFPHTMNSIGYNRKFFIETTTRFCFTRPNCKTTSNKFFTTDTLAFPFRTFSMFIFSTFKNSKAIKSFSGKINKWWHNIILPSKGLFKLFRNAAGGCLSTTFRVLPYPHQYNIKI